MADGHRRSISRALCVGCLLPQHAPHSPCHVPGRWRCPSAAPELFPAVPSTPPTPRSSPLFPTPTSALHGAQSSPFLPPEKLSVPSSKLPSGRCATSASSLPSHPAPSPCYSQQWRVTLVWHFPCACYNVKYVCIHKPT